METRRLPVHKLRYELPPLPIPRKNRFSHLLPNPYDVQERLESLWSKWKNRRLVNNRNMPKWYVEYGQYPVTLRAVMNEILDWRYPHSVKGKEWSLEASYDSSEREKTLSAVTAYWSEEAETELWFPNRVQRFAKDAERYFEFMDMVTATEEAVNLAEAAGMIEEEKFLRFISDSEADEEEFLRLSFLW